MKITALKNNIPTYSYGNISQLNETREAIDWLLENLGDISIKNITKKDIELLNEKFYEEFLETKPILSKMEGNIDTLTLTLNRALIALRLCYADAELKLMKSRGVDLSRFADMIYMEMPLTDKDLKANEILSSLIIDKNNSKKIISNESGINIVKANRVLNLRLRSIKDNACKCLVNMIKNNNFSKQMLDSKDKLNSYFFTNKLDTIKKESKKILSLNPKNLDEAIRENSKLMSMIQVPSLMLYYCWSRFDLQEVFEDDSLQKAQRHLEKEFWDLYSTKEGYNLLEQMVANEQNNIHMFIQRYSAFGAMDDVIDYDETVDIDKLMKLKFNLSYLHGRRLNLSKEKSTYCVYFEPMNMTFLQEDVINALRRGYSDKFVTESAGKKSRNSLSAKERDLIALSPLKQINPRLYGILCGSEGKKTFEAITVNSVYRALCLRTGWNYKQNYLSKVVEAKRARAKIENQMIPSPSIPPYELKMIINTFLDETGLANNTASGYRCDCFTFNPVMGPQGNFAGWAIDTFEPAIYSDAKKFDDNERYGNVDHILNQFPTNQKITDIKSLCINSITMMNEETKDLLSKKYDNNLSSSYLTSIKESLQYWIIKKYLGEKGISEWEKRNDILKQEMWNAFVENNFDKQSINSDYGTIKEEYNAYLQHLAFDVNVIHKSTNLEDLHENKVNELIDYTQSLSAKQELDISDYSNILAINVRERFDTVLSCIEKNQLGDLYKYQLTWRDDSFEVIMLKIESERPDLFRKYERFSKGFSKKY